MKCQRRTYWRGGLVATALVVVIAACSGSTSGSTDLPSTSSIESSASASRPTLVTVPPVSDPVSTTTEPAIVEAVVEFGRSDSQLTWTSHAAVSSAVEGAVIEAEELADGSLVFVAELPDGTPGSTLTVTDQSLGVRHEIEVGDAPFVFDSGWPEVAVVWVGDRTRPALLDAQTGELLVLGGSGGGEMALFASTPGRRFVPALEIDGEGQAYVLDLDDRVLRPVEGVARAGVPEISDDGQWVIGVPTMVDRGARSLTLVRPDRPDLTIGEWTVAPGFVFEKWRFDNSGRLWVTTRPESPLGERVVHMVDIDSGEAEVVMTWGPGEGYRPIDPSGTPGGAILVEERSSGDHLLVDANREVLARIERPPEDPDVFGRRAGYFEDNEVTLVDLTSGAVSTFLAVGSPTPSAVDLSEEGHYWIADGYAVGEIGLFRVDLATGEFIDYRPAVADLDEGEHFFSFDPSRFASNGGALVSYQQEDQSWLVRLNPDGTSALGSIEPGRRIVDISLSPTERSAVLLAGDRSPDVRESIAHIVDLESLEVDTHDDALSGQKLVVWLSALSQ